MPTDNNLDKWASYAKRNSYDGSQCKAQSKRNLAPVKSLTNEEVIWSDDAWQTVPDESRVEGRGWALSDDRVAARNCYTGKGGNKRD